MSNLFRPIMKHEQKYDQFTKTNSCLLENNTKVLGNDDADVNNQKSRNYLNSRDTKSQWKKVPNFIVRKIKMSDSEYSSAK